MKRIFTSALAILLATAAVQAQSDTTKAPHREHHDMQREGGYKQLNLSADQQAKLKSLRDEFKQKHDALDAQKLSEAERRTQMQALREQHKAAMDAILTPAQKEQMTKMQAERKDRMGNRKSWRSDSTRTKGGQGWQGRDGKGGAALQKELNLTTEQQAKMKEIRTGFKAKAEALRNDQTLTDEQRRTQMRDLLKQQQEQIKTVLTKEQQEKLQSLRKEHAARDTK